MLNPEVLDQTPVVLPDHKNVNRSQAKRPSRITFKRIVLSLLHRLGAKLDLVERRDDPRYQIAHIGKNVALGQVHLDGNNAIGSDVEFVGKVHLGYSSTVGNHCILYGGDISVGKYCQLAPYVAFYAIEHPSNYLTTYVNKRLFDGQLKQNNVQASISVGHDVWIGHGSIVLKGVRIGNGAIVGAGSVVTRDVPDYGIVAGNPARTIRRRFDQELIKLLSELAWWDRDPEEIQSMKPLFFTNLTEDHSQAVSLIRRWIADRRSFTPAS